MKAFDELTPVYALKTIEVPWSLAAGASTGFSFSAPSVPGYGYITPTLAYSGVGGVAVDSCHWTMLNLHNRNSTPKSGTAKVQLLYLRP
ncbi:hypothetical protein [uncultured Adlercreutzia sp.]|uniref:hypothetical protein n=1 Tax=uncultured Adlercreutzia sp. TaxID=875803 RepID=UPI0025FFDD51|nr:hypothetical protein [uncultured Adlercreutzia sp.]